MASVVDPNMDSRACRGNEGAFPGVWASHSFDGPSLLERRPNGAISGASQCSPSLGTHVVSSFLFGGRLGAVALSWGRGAPGAFDKCGKKGVTGPDPKRDPVFLGLAWAPHSYDGPSLLGWLSMQNPPVFVAFSGYCKTLRAPHSYNGPSLLGWLSASFKSTQTEPGTAASCVLTKAGWVGGCC